MYIIIHLESFTYHLFWLCMCLTLRGCKGNVFWMFQVLVPSSLFRLHTHAKACFKLLERSLGILTSPLFHLEGIKISG